MVKSSRHGVIEEVAVMIRTGASEESCYDYVDNLLISDQITTRVYSLLIGMISDSYN